MKSRFPSLDLPRVPLAADASVAINLLGTGICELLIRNLARPIIMAEEALAEVYRHPFPGADLLAEMGRLRDGGFIREQTLGTGGRAIFRELIADDLKGGLDDGEAATIALAIEHSIDTVAVVDERKACRIFAERWGERTITNTVTLLAQPETQGKLKPDEFAQACQCALKHARMRVPAEAMDWMIGVIGLERARSIGALASALRGMHSG